MLTNSLQVAKDRITQMESTFSQDSDSSSELVASLKLQLIAAQSEAQEAKMSSSTGSNAVESSCGNYQRSTSKTKVAC